MLIRIMRSPDDDAPIDYTFVNSVSEGKSLLHKQNIHNKEALNTPGLKHRLRNKEDQVQAVSQADSAADIPLYRSGTDFGIPDNPYTIHSPAPGELPQTVRKTRTGRSSSMTVPHSDTQIRHEAFQQEPHTQLDMGYDSRHGYQAGPRLQTPEYRQNSFARPGTPDIPEWLKTAQQNLSPQTDTAAAPRVQHAIHPAAVKQTLWGITEDPYASPLSTYEEAGYPQKLLDRQRETERQREEEQRRAYPYTAATYERRQNAGDYIPPVQSIYGMNQAQTYPIPTPPAAPAQEHGTTEAYAPKRRTRIPQQSDPRSNNGQSASPVQQTVSAVQYTEYTTGISSYTHEPEGMQYQVQPVIPVNPNPSVQEYIPARADRIRMNQDTVPPPVNVRQRKARALPEKEAPYRIVEDKKKREKRSIWVKRDERKRRSRFPFIPVLIFLIAVALAAGVWYMTNEYEEKTRDLYGYRAALEENRLKTHPLGYKSLILEKSNKYNISPAFVASIILNESSYKSDAVSSVNARGLMQLMDETAKWIHKKVRPNTEYTFDNMFKPEINIEYGCWYLGYLSDLFGGDPVLVAAAFHAGQGEVKNWLSDPKYSADGKTIKLENMIEGPTKKYATRVLNDYATYKRLYFEEVEENT